MARPALFRPVIFVPTATGLVLGSLVMLDRPSPPPAPQPVPPAAVKPIVLPDPEPSPPITATDFRGFQGFQAKPSQPPPQPQPADPDPPTSDRYDLTVRLEKGDTIDK